MADMKAKTAGEQADEIRLKREEILLQKEVLELDRVRGEVAERTAQIAYRTRQSRLRQANTQNQAKAAAKLAGVCVHRQGGQNGDVYKGKGTATALKVEKMPDGFTIRIRCLCCPLRITNPLPSDASKKLKSGETPEDRTARVAKYEADKARFDKYYRMSQDDALTNEAGAPMECGTTFKVTDENGNQIYKQRPSDSYATEMEMTSIA